MKKITKTKSLILIAIGIFVIASSQIVSHYVKLSDFTNGSFIGIGIGLLLIGLIFGNLKTAR